MKIKDIVLKYDGYVDFYGENNTEVYDITLDSRKIEKGKIFVAIKGFKLDGHDYIEQAVTKGASLIVCDQIDRVNSKANFLVVDDSRKALADISNILFDNPSKKFNLIGITGTNGKTSITYLMKQIFEYMNKKTALIGTLGVMIGDKKLPTSNTTPESHLLAKDMIEMVNESVDVCTMEVSSHATELSRVRGLDFDYAVFTNLTKDHLNFHETMENYYEAKKKLFLMDEKLSIINIDDKYGDRLYRELRDANKKVVSYGIKSNANYKAENIKTSIKGSEFDLMIKGENKHIIVRTPGNFSILNSLAAIIVAVEMKLDKDTIIEALSKYSGVPGRFEILPTALDCTVIIDFAHTPDGFEKICSTIDEFAVGRKIALYGGQGERDHNRRGPMGEIAAKHGFYSIITTDNPVYENPKDICEEIALGVKKHEGKYKIILDREEAINYCMKNYEKNDIILFAGKSTEPYQMIEDRKDPWNEKLVAENAIKRVEKTFQKY